ncbi:MAG: lactonase family protein, partial [Chthoniobacterales bacterium]
MKPIVFAALIMSGPMAFAGDSEPFLIGTYTSGAEASASRGIYSAVLNTSNGTITDLKLAAEVASPSFLAYHPTLDVIYAVVEAAEFNSEPGGGIVAFSRDAATMEWKPLSNQAVGGQSPCHLALDPTGQVVVTANYGDGTVSVFPVKADGSIGPRSQFIQHVKPGANASQQRAAHAHGITFSPDSQFVFVPDLGLDQIKIYQVDAAGARLTAVE